MFEQKIKVKLAPGQDCFNDPASQEQISNKDTEGKFLTMTLAVLKAIKDKVLIRL